MNEIKVFLGAIAIALVIASNIPYVVGILRNQTKPHAFTWFVWALGSSIAFLAQIIGGAGAGSWPMGVAAFCSILIFFLSLWKGHKDITSSDYLALSISLIALCFWFATSDPTLSVILMSIADAVAFYPTIRKSFLLPTQENVSHYSIDLVQLTFQLLALESYSLITWLYPATVLFCSFFLIVIVVIRRFQLRPE